MVREPSPLPNYHSTRIKQPLGNKDAEEGFRSAVKKPRTGGAGPLGSFWERVMGGIITILKRTPSRRLPQPHLALPFVHNYKLNQTL
jgi:hypothetical protein